MNISVASTMIEYDKKVDLYCGSSVIIQEPTDKFSYFSNLDELNMSIKSDPNEVKIGDQRNIVDFLDFCSEYI